MCLFTASGCFCENEHKQFVSEYGKSYIRLLYSLFKSTDLKKDRISHRFAKYFKFFQKYARKLKKSCASKFDVLPVPLTVRRFPFRLNQFIIFFTCIVFGVFMQEHNDLSAEIYDLLRDGRQLSISGITRELKARGLNEHRLIVTGYLRALHDLDYLNEFDLSPSKIYTLKDAGAGSFSKSEKKASLNTENTAGGFEIYTSVGDKISKLTSPDVRLETAVYIFSTLFDRPCFESELSAAGIDAALLSKYFGPADASEKLVFKSKSEYKRYYDEIPSLSKGSTAYEIHAEKLDTDFFMRAVKILNALLKDAIDISELVSKSGNKSLLDF